MPANVVAKRVPITLEETKPEKQPAAKKKSPSSLLERRDPSRFEQAVIDYICALNEEGVAVWVYPKNPTRQDQKDQLQNLIAQMEVNDQLKEKLSQAFSVVFGEPIDYTRAVIPNEGANKCVAGMVWIPLNNRDGNNYPLGSPMIAVNVGWPNVNGLRLDRQMGNNLNVQPGNARLANRDEVTSLVKVLGAKKIARDLRLVIVG